MYFLCNRALLPFLLLVTIHISASAQYQGNDATAFIHRHPNTGLAGSTVDAPTPKAQPWERKPDLISGHITHTRLAAMKTRTQALVAFLRDSLFVADTSLPGYTTVWHGEYFSGGSGSLLKFAVQSSFYNPEDPGASKADLLVLANDLSPLLGHCTINGSDYSTIKGTLSTRNGCRYLEHAANPNNPDPGSNTPDPDSSTPDSKLTCFWLITTDSTHLPYTPITRREYLLEIRKQLIADTNHISNDWRSRIAIRPAALQGAEKEKELDHLKSLYTGIDLQAHTRIFLQNYLSDEAYLQQNIRNATIRQCSTLHFIDSLLLNPEANQLSRPAVIPDPAAANPNSPGTTSPPPTPTFADNLPNALTLVKPNPTYFDPYLSEEKPQFFILGWRFTPNDPVAAALNRFLVSPLKLRQMLGK